MHKRHLSEEMMEAMATGNWSQSHSTGRARNVDLRSAGSLGRSVGMISPEGSLIGPVFLLCDDLAQRGT